MARKAHVVRLFQCDDQGNVVDENTWLDVLRIDRFFCSEPRGSQDGGAGLIRQYAVQWGDDTVPSFHIPPRKISKLTVTKPSDGGGPPDPNAAHVDIPLIERTRFNFRGPAITGTQGETHLAIDWVFRNDPDLPTGRKSTVVRVTNNDLNNAIKMPIPQAGDPQPPTNPTAKDGGGHPWSDYVNALKAGTIDDTQYVDVEVTDRFEVRFPPPTFNGHIITYVLAQKQQGNNPLGVEDVFKPPPGGAGGKPWRTDPFQTIVNVSWGQGLAVEFGDKAAGAPGAGSGGGGGGG